MWLIFIVRVQIKAALGQHNSFQQTEEIKEGGGRNFLNFKYISFDFQCNVDVELVSTASFSESSCSLDFHGQRQLRLLDSSWRRPTHLLQAFCLQRGCYSDLRGHDVDNKVPTGEEKEKKKVATIGPLTLCLRAWFLLLKNNISFFLMTWLLKQNVWVSEWVSEGLTFSIQQLQQQFASEGKPFKAPQKTSSGFLDFVRLRLCKPQNPFNSKLHLKHSYQAFMASLFIFTEAFRKILGICVFTHDGGCVKWI